MKLPHRLALTALLGVPLTLFFVARRASEKRPVLLATIPNSDILAFSSNGKTLAVGTRGAGPNFFHLLDIKTGRPLGKQSRENFLLPPLLSPDGSQIARVENLTLEPSHPSQYEFGDSRFYLTDSNSPKEKVIEDPLERPGNEGDIPPNQDARWTPNGKELVVAGVRQVRRFEASTGKILSCITIAPLQEKTSVGVLSASELRPIRPVALSPDGKWLARVQNSQSIFVRNTATARLIRTIRASPKSGQWYSLGWSPRSHLLWADDGDVSFFNVQNSQLLWRWKGLSNFQISHDEKLVVACNGSNCIARDTKAGRELWRVKNPNSPTFALSPDGKTLVEAKPNGQIFLWPLPQTH